MQTITLEDAQAHLSELIDNLPPGEEVVITRGDQPVAKIISQTAPPRGPRRPGSLSGTVLYMAPDFNASIEC